MAIMMNLSSSCCFGGAHRRFGVPAGGGWNRPGPGFSGDALCPSYISLSRYMMSRDCLWIQKGTVAIRTPSSAWARRAPRPPHLTLLPTGLFGQVFGDEQACFAAAHDVEVSIAIQILYRDLHAAAHAAAVVDDVADPLDGAFGI